MNARLTLQTCNFARMKKAFLITLTFLLATHGYGYDTLFSDLSNTWQVYEGKTYRKFEGKGNAIHFILGNDAKGTLEIKGESYFSVFFNDKLYKKGVGKIEWDIENLKRTHPFPLRVSIYSSRGVSGLSTRLINIGEESNTRKGNYSFRNGIIVSSLILLIALVALIRNNPQATLEYFNVLKVFSVRNSDEGVVTIRVTSANNAFLYFFCSALVAFNLLIYFNNDKLFSKDFSVLSFFIELSLSTVIVFGILLSKIIIIRMVARLFRLSEFAPGQFYNFVRLLLIGFSFTSIVLLTTYMLGVHYEGWLTALAFIIVFMLAGFLTATFIKLNNRGGFTVFHLFSYLCASEIFPLVILLNVFFS